MLKYSMVNFIAEAAKAAARAFVKEVSNIAQSVTVSILATT